MSLVVLVVLAPQVQFLGMVGVPVVVQRQVPWTRQCRTPSGSAAVAVFFKVVDSPVVVQLSQFIDEVLDVPLFMLRRGGVGGGRGEREEEGGEGREGGGGSEGEEEVVLSTQVFVQLCALLHLIMATSCGRGPNKIGTSRLLGRASTPGNTGSPDSRSACIRC